MLTLLARLWEWWIKPVSPVFAAIFLLLYALTVLGTIADPTPLHVIWTILLGVLAAPGIGGTLLRAIGGKK
jgi:hypothetical protein